MNILLSQAEESPTDLMKDVRYPHIQLLQVNTDGLHDIIECTVVFLNHEEPKRVRFIRAMGTGEYYSKKILIPTETTLIDLTIYPKCFVSDIIWEVPELDEVRKLLLVIS